MQALTPNNTLDIDIFKLLKSQAKEVFSLLLVVREFATAKGLHHEVDRLNDYIEENKQIISIANDQLSELEQTTSIYRIGFFEIIKPL